MIDIEQSNFGINFSLILGLFLGGYSESCRKNKNKMLKKIKNIMFVMLGRGVFSF